MKLFDGLVFLTFFILGITSCGPKGPSTDRIATSRSITAAATPNAEDTARASRLRTISRELLEAADDRPNPDESTASELDARSNRAREMITSLNMELSIHRSTSSDELRALRDRQEMESRAEQSRLTDVTLQIQNQERVVVERQAAMTTAIAPEGGDLRNWVEGEYARALAELNRLRANYSSLLQNQSLNPNQYYSEQREQLDTLRSRQSEFSEMIQSASADLEAATREKAALQQAKRLRSSRINRLRAERDALSNSN